VIGFIRAELLKIFTTRMWWGLLIGVVVGAAAFAGLTAGIAGIDTGGGQTTPGVDDPATVRSIYAAGLGIAYLCTLALGVVTMAGERRHRTVSGTLLASPRRWRVVIAKLIALLAAGAGYGVACVAGSIAVGLPVILVKGGQAHLTDFGVPRTLALVVLAVGLWAVIGLGVGTLINNQIVGLMVSVAVAWIVDPLLALGLNFAHAGSTARFLPGQATGAMVSPGTSSQGLRFDVLPWWGGALTLVGYAVVAGGLGMMLTLRRDVT
jgi:ABC-2 type transport system permease protein